MRRGFVRPGRPTRTRRSAASAKRVAAGLGGGGDVEEVGALAPALRATRIANRSMAVRPLWGLIRHGSIRSSRVRVDTVSRRTDIWVPAKMLPVT